MANFINPYDAQAEWEIGDLLEALDDRVAEMDEGNLADAAPTRQVRRMADVCAAVLSREARSAEGFIQLLERALWNEDYASVDRISDQMTSRLAPSELCEIARHPNAQVHSLAREALMQLPPSVLLELLKDPLDELVARESLEGQADDYESDEARWILSMLNDRLDISV